MTREKSTDKLRKDRSLIRYMYFILDTNSRLSVWNKI